MNTKKLPTLESQFIGGDTAKPRRQSSAQARMAMDIISGQWGMKARPVTPATIDALKRAGLHG